MTTPRPLLALLFVFAATTTDTLAELPNVEVETKADPTSPLTLKAIWTLGYNVYSKAGTDAVANLKANKDLEDTLEAESKLSAAKLSFLTLKRICTIESRCDLTMAYKNAAYKGYFQMGAGACSDVGIAFTDIDDPTEWKKSCEAGRKFLDKKWKNITDAGIQLTDGTRPALTFLYLTHQLGAAGGPALFKKLESGTAGPAPATSDMVNNISSASALKAIQGTTGHKLTQLEFYAYWAGSLTAVMEKVQ